MFDFTALSDFLTIEQTVDLINRYRDQHGPWPLHAYPGSTAFSRGLYRYLNHRDTVVR